LIVSCCGRSAFKNVTECEFYSAGHSIIEGPCEIYDAWIKGGRFRNFETVVRGRIITFMAGRAAELEFFGSCQGGDGDDQYQVDLMLDEAVSYSSDEERDNAVAWCRPRLEAACARLTKRHRTKIERLVKALLDEGKLESYEINEIIDQSISSPSSSSSAPRAGSST
jgi:hypothetical protein